MYLCYVSDILTLISLVSLITATYQGKDYNGQETQQSLYETEKPGNTTSLYKMDFSPQHKSQNDLPYNLLTGRT